MVLEYNLQFFAKDGPGGEKTEEPTAKKLEDARKEGQVAKSREVANGLGLLAVFLVLKLWVGNMGYQFMNVFTVIYEKIPEVVTFWHGNMPQQDTTLVFRKMMLEAVVIMAPLLLIGFLIAFLSDVVQVGWHPTGKTLQPKFSKLNPLPGIKRMFSAQTGAELLKAILKTILVGSVTGFYLWHHWPQMMRLMAESPITAMGNAMDLVGLCALLVVLGVIPMVGFDVFFQIFSHLKKLRMSRQDIRDEFKQSEGDPHVKGRIRQMQRAAARRRMMADVPKADVIVNNPTHYSVALQYDENKMSAPKVVAKGAGLVALRIREIGAENNVPTLEAPPLARALYRHAEIGQQIPGQLYAAVAEVLAWVWQLKRWRLAGGQRPVQPTHLPVPEALDFINEKPTHE